MDPFEHRVSAPTRDLLYHLDVLDTRTPLYTQHGPPLSSWCCHWDAVWLGRTERQRVSAAFQCFVLSAHPPGPDL